MRTLFLHRGGDTHAESIRSVQLVDGKYQHVEVVAELGEVNGAKELGRFFSTGLSIAGRYGMNLEITEAEAAALVSKDQELKAERTARAFRASPIAAGDVCHSCGKPRQGTKACGFCGDDTRF